MKRSRIALRTALVIAVLAVGYVDYITGYEFSMVLVYFLPITIVAWYESWQVVLGVSILSGIVWYVSDTMSGSAHSRLFYRYWEGVVKVTTFVIVGRCIYRTKKAIREKEAMETELRQVREEAERMRQQMATCPECNRK